MNDRMNPGMNAPIPGIVAVIDCHTAVRRLWDYLDGELDAPRFAEVEQHVATCAGCAEHVRFAQAFLRSVRQAAAPSAGAEPADDALRQRILARLTAEGFRRRT